ncbi:MAG TPA: hypothetical protein VGP89_19120 [Candidatus Angelobacter sp.]|jgi:hypothetical protein|nr:hypothetical protein [Candidatus Angelobacter sp.]
MKCKPHGLALPCRKCNSAKGGRATARKHSAKLKVWGKQGGKAGGRPGNPEVKRIMAERGVSRQRAHQILKERKDV